jgi:hypothetical protein
MNENELRQSLNRLNLSAAEAGQLLGVTPRTVRRWLDGEEMTGPAVQAIRAWIRLHNRHLPWRPDTVSIIEDDQDQIERHRLHTINFDAILSRVEKRNTPRLPWVVDWDRGKATLGPMEVGFYKLTSGGFSLSTYHRRDASPDVERDIDFIEEAVYCIAQALKKLNADFGPVVLVVQDGPAKGRVASQRHVTFPTLRAAIHHACQGFSTASFHEPFIATENPMELLHDHNELRRICKRRIEAPPALEAVAAYARQHSNLFASAMLGQAEKQRRQQYIEEQANKISDLAKKAHDGLVSHLEFDALLGALHAVGFFPKGDLVSAVSRALVE